jgi:hypothetical protein
MVDVLIRSPRRTIRKDTAAYASLLSSLVKEQVPHAETQKQPRVTSPLPCQEGQAPKPPDDTLVEDTAADETDLVSVASAVNRHRESF